MLLYGCLDQNLNVAYMKYLLGLLLRLIEGERQKRLCKSHSSTF